MSKLFSIDVSVVGYKTVQVRADDEKEAAEMARELVIDMLVYELNYKSMETTVLGESE